VKSDPFKNEPMTSEPVRSDQTTSMAAQSNTQLDKSTQSLKFDELDKNHDGFITKDEVPATIELSTSFVNFDNNADGRLSKDEYAKYKPMKDESKVKIDRY
jgi:Ca2+-binding EF-hand superfamily protein